MQRKCTRGAPLPFRTLHQQNENPELPFRQLEAPKCAVYAICITPESSKLPNLLAAAVLGCRRTSLRAFLPKQHFYVSATKTRLFQPNWHPIM